MPFKNMRSLLAILIAVALLSLMIACGSDDDEDEPDEPPTGTAQAGTPYKATGNEGNIVGTIALNGTAPQPKPISMDADAACAAANPNAVTGDVMVKDGKVQNVVVFVKDGKTADGRSITGFSFPAPSDARVLDQHGCNYVPRVVGIQTQQKLSVINSDKTTHNVNVQPKTNPGFNQAQSQGQAPIEKTFTRAETLIPVKCNQHPWMKAYISVFGHPFYAVSDPDGKFEVKGLPPGTYTLVAWHERFGEKSQSVTVGAKESKTQDFSFDAGATASLQGGSLEVMPALDLPMLMNH